VIHESDDPPICVLYSFDTIKRYSSGRLTIEGKGTDNLNLLDANIRGNPFCQPKRFFAGIAKGTIQNPGEIGSDNLIVKYVYRDRLLIEEIEYVVNLSDTLLISYTSRLSLRKEDVLFRTNEVHYLSAKKELPDICFDSMAERIIQKQQESIEAEQNQKEEHLAEQIDQEQEDLTEEAYPEEGDSTASLAILNPQAGVDFSRYPMINLQGDTFSLGASDSQYILLYFWYFGCPPCHRAIPAVNAIQKEYPHVRVIGVNHINQRFSELEVYSQRSGMEFDIAYMPRFAREHPGGVPRFYVLDPDLRVIHMTWGYSPRLIREVRDVLDALPTGN